jgi:uncharacterized protein involved in exopolysaccharide biosynthesis
MEELQERHVSFNDYLRIFYRGRWIILTTFLVVMAITAYVTFTAMPEYEGAAKIMIEEKGGMEQSIFDIGGFINQATMVNNQVEILKSRMLAETVVKRLQASEWADKLSLLNPPDNGKTGLFADAGRWLQDLIGFGGDAAEQRTIDEIIKDLLDRLTITPIRDTDMIEIKVTGATPEEAVFVTNTLATAYSEKSRLESQEEVRQVKKFLDEQLKLVQQQLTESEESLKDFKKGEKVTALPDETKELIQKMAEFEGLYNEALTEYNSNRQRLEYVDQQLDRSKKNFDLSNISATPYFDGLKRQIGELEGKRTSYIANLINGGVYRDDDPQARRYEEQINMLKKQLQEEITKLATVEILNPVAMSENLVARKIEIEANLQALQPKVEALKKIIRRMTSNWNCCRIKA